MRVVLDANVIVAAFASRGLCESIFELCLDSHEIVLCDELIGEIATSLIKKIKLPAKVVNEIVGLLREQGNILRAMPLDSNLCRDIDDIKVLGLAAASGADYIVTGDKDLLVLKEFQAIPIVTPRSFSDILHNGKFGKII